MQHELGSKRRRGERGDKQRSHEDSKSIHMETFSGWKAYFSHWIYARYSGVALFLSTGILIHFSHRNFPKENIGKGWATRECWLIRGGF